MGGRGGRPFFGARLACEGRGRGPRRDLCASTGKGAPTWRGRRRTSGCSGIVIYRSPRHRRNPVFSVHQTDIIYYGSDLEHYLHKEFYYYFGTPACSLGSAGHC